MFNELAANYCARCGAPLAAGARFCSTCGTLVGAVSAVGVLAIELAGARYDLASFWRRAGAFLVDGFFWSVVSWPISAAFQVSTFGSGFPQLESGETPSAEFWGAFAQAFDSFMVYLAVSTMTVSLAQVAFEAFGWTPGKAVFGIRVLRADGYRPGIVHGLARSFARVLSSLPFGLGYFWVAWDPRRQAWHDKLAHTYVVRLPATAPAVAGTEPHRDWGPVSIASGAWAWAWASLHVLLLVGTVVGALWLAAAVPDDGASWQRFFEDLEATPVPTPFRARVSEAPAVLHAVRLIDVRVTSTPATL